MRGRTSPPLTRRPRGLLQGWKRWLVLVLQLLLFVIPVQTTGVLHVVADVVGVLVGEQIHQGKPPCPHEENGEHCPPGCPDCHCLVVLHALPVASPPLLFVRAMAPIEVGFAHDATAPPPPLLTGVERPPRGLFFA